jgi:hypothetical protein
MENTVVKPKRCLSAYLYFCSDISSKMNCNPKIYSQLWNEFKNNPEHVDKMEKYTELAMIDKERYTREMIPYNIFLKEKKIKEKQEENEAKNMIKERYKLELKELKESKELKEVKKSKKNSKPIEHEKHMYQNRELREEPPVDHIRRESREESMLEHRQKDSIEEPRVENRRREQLTELRREEPRLEHRRESREEPRIEHRRESREEPRLEHRREAREEPRIEHRREAREEPRVEHRREAREEPRVEHRREAREEPRVEHRREAREEPRIEHRREARREPLPKESHKVNKRDIYDTSDDSDDNIIIKKSHESSKTHEKNKNVKSKIDLQSLLKKAQSKVQNQVEESESDDDEKISNFRSRY